MSSTFLIVIVIYETHFKDSQTCQSLFQTQSTADDFPDILIYDNSSTSRYDERYSKNIAYYKHDPDNSGVGGAYNYALKIGRSADKEWLILFDQDTKVSNNYFKQLQVSIATFSNEKLFCPNVRSEKKIISPAKYFAFRAFGLNKPKAGILKTQYFTVINSGLTIKLSELVELGGYDIELPLDYSDHYFFFKFKKRNRNFVAIKCENLHSLSSNSDRTYEKVFTRFKKYCNSTFIYSKKVDSRLPLTWLFFRTLKLTLKFFKIEFFKFLLYKT